MDDETQQPRWAPAKVLPSSNPMRGDEPERRHRVRPSWAKKTAALEISRPR
jgi:hypothetical protein